MLKKYIPVLKKKPGGIVTPAMTATVLVVMLLSAMIIYPGKTSDKMENTGKSPLGGPTPGWSPEVGKRNPSDHVVINEVYYDGVTSDYTTEGDEFIELYNAGTSAQDLTGWIVSDGEGTADLPSITLGPGEYLVLARNADDFYATFGFEPDYEWDPTNTPGPHSQKVPDLQGPSPGSIALANGGDEVYIASSSTPDQSVDAVVWGSYTGNDLPEGVWSGTTPPSAGNGESIERSTAGYEGNEEDGPDSDSSPENDEDLANTFVVSSNPTPVPELTDIATFLPVILLSALAMVRKKK